MPNFVTADYLLGRAQELAKEAKDLSLSEDFSAEDVEKVEKLKEEITQYQKRAHTAMDLDNVLSDTIEKHKQQEQQKLEEDNQRKEQEQKRAEFSSVGEQVVAIYNHYKHGTRHEGLKYINADTGVETKDLAESAGSTGGFLVPVEQRTDMMSVAAEQSIVRGRATIIPMSRREITMPVLDQTGTTEGEPHWFGGIQTYWQAEAAEKAQSDPSFRNIRLVANALVGYTRVSEELLADSAISLEAFLRSDRGFAGAVAWAEDRAFFNGTGVGQPKGVLSSGVTTSVARQEEGSVTYEDLLQMEASFYSPSNRGVWVISQSQKFNVMSMTGPTGNPEYLYRPSAREGEPATLLGRPVIFTLDRLPRGTNTSEGDVLLADWSFYLIGDRRMMTIDSTDQERWRFNQVSWKVTTRVDGQPWLSAPITSTDGNTTVSPFVILGAKST